MAWLILSIAFLLFSTLLGSAIYATWYYQRYATDTQGSVLIVRSPAEWVTWRRKNRTTFERARDQQVLEEGDRVRIDNLAGYGQAATLLLADQSTLDMWAGTDLLLKEMRTSRWSKEMQQFSFQQDSGYIRYDLNDDQRYEQVRFVVHAGETQIELHPGGSYSIEIAPSNRQLHFSGNGASLPALIDVAVRSGHAEVSSQNRTVAILQGERIVVGPGGMPSQPMPALWELIRDGDFRRYNEEEYNNTTVTDQPMLRRSDTWQVYSGSLDTVQGAAQGFFKLTNGCRPPYPELDCAPEERLPIAWFVRNGGQTRNFTTGVLQMLGADEQGIDISEYRSLVFSIWVRVLHQSIELAGDKGTECPVMVRFIVKQSSPSDAEQEHVICFYSSEDPGAEPERNPAITYYRLEPGAWYPFVIDLRAEEWLPEARYIQSIAIYANGHDYTSQITDVSLIGSHYRRVVNLQHAPTGPAYGGSNAQEIPAR